jgi:hypothetical protein
MRNRQALALAWILAALGAAVLGGASRPPVTLAILREDGILIPFATFDGKWKNKWPQPVAEAEVPITLGDVPKSWWPDGRVQREWTLWSPDGSSRRLTVTAPAWMRAQCVSNVGLRTDFKSEVILPDPETMPYPKAGLATSAGAEAVKVEPVSVVDPSSEELKPLLKNLDARFRAAEERADDEAAYRWTYLDAFQKGPIVTEAVHRGPDIVPGRFVYYFEMTRRHTKGLATGWLLSEYGVEPPPCDLVTFASGWARLGQGRQDVSMEAVVTDCNREEAVFQYPFGVIRVYGGRPLWIVQWSTWQAEWYSVVDFGNPLQPRALFETWGGGCR